MCAAHIGWGALDQLPGPAALLSTDCSTAPTNVSRCSRIRPARCIAAEQSLQNFSWHCSQSTSEGNAWHWPHRGSAGIGPSGGGRVGAISSLEAAAGRGRVSRGVLDLEAVTASLAAGKRDRRGEGRASPCAGRLGVDASPICCAIEWSTSVTDLQRGQATFGVPS